MFCHQLIQTILVLLTLSSSIPCNPGMVMAHWRRLVAFLTEEKDTSITRYDDGRHIEVQGSNNIISRSIVVL